jgi:hypothetical protein
MRGHEPSVTDASKPNKQLHQKWSAKNLFHTVETYLWHGGGGGGGGYIKIWYCNNSYNKKCSPSYVTFHKM